MKKIEVRTTAQCELTDITSRVESVVRESKITDGLCYVFVPHTTAGSLCLGP